MLMGWASHYIAKLVAGETVSFRPKGSSMAGKINSGQLCTLMPVTDPTKLQIGDIVLCRVQGAEYLHLIKAVRGPGETFQIGNNRGGINGWIGPHGIYGICVKVEP